LIGVKAGRLLGDQRRGHWKSG